MNKKLFYIILLIISSQIDYSCKKESNTITDIPTYKIAVCMPLSGPLRADWESSINWIKTSINKAGGVAGRNLEIVWYDSQTGDIEKTAEGIAKDTSIVAMIGPFTSSNAMKAAPYFIKNKKVMFTPASSGEITRAFSGKDYVWRLIEPDITQCKIQMLIVKSKKVKSVALLTSNDEYGITFYNWFGFFAAEMGIPVTRVEKYDSELKDLNMETSLVLSTNPELLVCAPSKMEQAVSIVNQWKISNSATKLLFSDIVYLPEFINELGDDAQGIEGTVMIPDPNSGFEIEYEIKYGKKPMLGVAQMYDALMLIAYGLEVSHGEASNKLVNAIKKVVDGRSGTSFWDDNSLKQTIQKLKNNTFPDIMGAGSSLDYDPDYYTDVITSTYAHWQINLDGFFNLNYYSDDGSGRHSSISASWRTYANNIKELVIGNELHLPEKKNLKALLLASSKGWSNYRHQADLLYCYQLLKKNGLTDDDIILIMEDDIAFNSRNTESGIIRNSENGSNLYTGVKIDYHLHDVTPEILERILTGKKNSNAPIVIESDSSTNILFYFADHGSPDGLLMEGEKDYVVGPSIFKSMLRQVSDSAKFRRMLILIEACYSGIIGNQLEFSSPILCITAANSNESSKAINYSNKINAWLSDNFSFHLLNNVTNDPGIDLLTLYTLLNKQVYGSHVSIFNEEHFGKLGNISMNEFFKP